MAITVRATSTGASANTTTGTINLPAGTTTGDVTFIAYFQTMTTYATSSVPTMTPPTGWTVLYNYGSSVVCYRAFQGGDPSTGITCTSTLTNWFESIAITYSGADTTNPVDCSAFNPRFAGVGTGTVTPLLCRAPSLNPNYNNSQLLCIFSEGGSTGRTIALPAGLTARVTTSIGPNLRMADKVLTNGNPTGTFDATVSGTSGELFFGGSIAVKASGATATTLSAAVPTVCGFYNVENNVSSVTLLLDRLNVQNNDLVVVAFNGADTVNSTPAGYTQQSSQQGVLLYTHPWLTGDTTGPVFGFNAGNFKSWGVALIRQAGVGAGSPVHDAIATTTATATSNPTATTSAQTPATTSDLQLVVFGTTSTTAGTWSAISDGVIDEVINASGPGLRFSWVLSPGGDPNFSSVQLLCHLDGANGATTTVDSSNAAHTLTVGTGLKLSTVAAKFGPSSADMSGGGLSQAISTPSNAAWQFGSGQFTVEIFVQYQSAHGTNNHAFMSVWNTDIGWYLGQGSSGQLDFIWSTTGADFPLINFAWSPVVGQWYHVAADRDASNTIRLYLDGVVVASTVSGVTFWPSVSPLYIGSGNGSVANPIPAYLDEARITKGVARYAGAFSPPTRAFPNTSSVNTVTYAATYTAGAGSITLASASELVKIGSAAITANLSGVHATGAIGSLHPTVSYTLAGVHGTGAVGAFTRTVSPTVHLTGVAGTGVVGSLLPEQGLVGVSATGQVGTITITASGHIVLDGVAATGAVGALTLTVAPTVHLTGVHASGAVGSLHPSLSDTLAGVHATGAVGSLVALIVDLIDLVGVAATGHVGTSLAANVVVTLVGVHGQGLAADISAIPFRWNLDLDGVAATGRVGALTERLQVTLRGVAASGHVGALHGALQSHLTGVAATGHAGALLGIPQGDGLRMGDFVVTGTVLQTPNVVSLRWSDTRGASWPMNPIDRSLGAEGEYLTTPTWYRLGMARDRIFELEWATPRATALTGAFIEYEQSK